LGAEGRRFKSCHPDEYVTYGSIRSIEVVKSTVEQLSPTRVKLSVEVPFEELSADFDRAYKSLAQQIRIPGFRPGKAPAKLIEARVGRQSILEQVVNDALPNKYSQAIAEADIKAISQPELDVAELEDGQPVRFTAEVDIRPEITLPEYSTIAVQVDAIEVADADVETELDNLRARFGTLVGVERGATNGAFVSIDLVATVNGETVDEATTEGLSHEVGSGDLVDGLEEALEGLKAGEKNTFTTKLVAGDHAGEEAEVTVTVNSVKERELPAVDDDFAQLASEFDTVDELRESLRERAGESKKYEQAGAIRDAVLEQRPSSSRCPRRSSQTRSRASSTSWSTHSVTTTLRSTASSKRRARPARSGTPRAVRTRRSRSGPSCCSTRSRTRPRSRSARTS
jgi:trigger factor